MRLVLDGRLVAEGTPEEVAALIDHIRLSRRWPGCDHGHKDAPAQSTAPGEGAPAFPDKTSRRRKRLTPYIDVRWEQLMLFGNEHTVQGLLA